jgi:hypothetical protein
MKTRDCTAADARNRLAQAERFLEAADVYNGEEDPNAANVSASNAVMAAIAASDAACSAALGKHAQGESHAEAAKLLEGVPHGGKAAGQALTRAVAVKNKAQYGLIALSKTDRDLVYKQAVKLIAFAKAVLER